MKKQIRDFIIISIITILLLEIVLRILGVKPYFFPPFSITSDPVGSLIPDSELGLTLNPGTYHITMNDSLEYETTRNDDSTRYTGISNAESIMEFHGCSFTYGMGVDTDKAFPYLLQEKIKDRVRISNQAVPGYGNIQNLLSLKNRLKEGDRDIPDTIIMFYASFHDERNTLTPHYRAHLYYGFLNMDNDIKKRFNNAEQVRFPYATLEKNELVIKNSALNNLFKPLPFREYSATINMVQNILITKKTNAIPANDISVKILMDMDSLCKENDIEFIVASIVKDEVSEKTLKKLRAAGVVTFDMGIDILNDNKYNNYPYDSHPNELAHRIYADRLYHYLNFEPIH